MPHGWMGRGKPHAVPGGPRSQLGAAVSGPCAARRGLHRPPGVPPPPALPGLLPGTHRLARLALRVRCEHDAWQHHSWPRCPPAPARPRRRLTRPAPRPRPPAPARPPDPRSVWGARPVGGPSPSLVLRPGSLAGGRPWSDPVPCGSPGTASSNSDSVHRARPRLLVRLTRLETRASRFNPETQPRATAVRARDTWERAWLWRGATTFSCSPTRGG